MEGPKLFARPRVEGANLSLDVVMGHDRHAFLHRHADDDHVARHDRRRVESRVALLQVYLLAVPANHADLEVHLAAFAEALNKVSGLGVQREEAIARVQYRIQTSPLAAVHYGCPP